MILTLIAAVLLIVAPKGSYAANALSVIDKSLMDKGIITVNYKSAKAAKAIVRIAKDDSKYDYHLVTGAHYPLQLGDGKYSVLVAEAAGNNKYKVVAQDTMYVKLANKEEVFLQSIQLINWDDKTKAVIESKQLTQNDETDMDKIASIYAYVTQNIKYDYEKAQTVEADYIPDLDAVYESEEGICYDYASVFAAMARSEGIPTRLVMGYSAEVPDTYHAWNQVYLQGSDKWVTIDTTYDAVRIQAGEETPMIKDEADYKISKIY
ncbi:transglutaminase domain-containing protein [Paenibacillus sp. WST5]|uniref:Transglutaminase domain-containing protein n=2 Tax=Paenibacillus sedimenti TaxID=2770274 RepID=A0A926KQ66_9BACL|nr:transglutaminase domain-containing protein [Paenibacillus sedimenti]